MEKIQALESKIKQLQHQKIKEQLEIDTAQLNDVERQITILEGKLSHPKAFNLNDEQIKKAEAELQALKQERVDLEIAVNTHSIDEAKSKIAEVDDMSVDVDLNMSMQNISQGVSQAKQGFSGLASSISEVQQAGMQSEQNLGFLANNVGGLEEAKKQMQQINDIVARMPGDDNTMRSVLSTAQALGNNLNPQQMEDATKTMADYMQGSATMGKQAIESQQDIMKYLLDGNTAELERGSIVSSRVDKLKEATTFQERQAAMQEVLNELGYGGIAGLDTTINKQAEWEGMLYNSQDALSSLWLGAEKGAMDYIIKLNDGTNGLLGMGIVAGQMAAGPLVDIMSGVGQIGIGFKTLKDAADLTSITDKLGNLKTKVLDLASSLKSTLIGAFDTLRTTLTNSIIPALRNAGMYMLDLGKKALTAGANALKSAGMWLVQKAQLVASTLATYAMSAAQAVLNFVMSMNPIMLVVIALAALVAALVWAYYNIDWVREAIDNLASTLMGVLTGAINWVMGLFNNFTSQLGLNTNNWIQAILGFILFIPQLPLQLGVALANAIAQALGFGNNFVQRLVTAGANAVNGFINYIKQIPNMVYQEFQRTLQLVNDFINSIPSRVWDMGTAIIDALKGALGIGSPGHMFYMVEGEFNRIDDLTKKTSFDTGGIGQGMVDNFNPNIATSNQGALQTGGNNITINIESVDNEERIQQIVQAVEDALAFDNLTAGRTV